VSLPKLYNLTVFWENINEEKRTTKAIIGIVLFSTLMTTLDTRS
jgi:hypothetical protein